MSKRTDRVSELIKREVGRILIREIKDPKLQFVTITSVKVSPDLKYSRIYYTIMGDASQRELTQQKLDHACGFMRSQIGKNLSLRYVPELKFYYDEVADYAANVERLLRDIKKGEDE